MTSLAGSQGSDRTLLHCLVRDTVQLYRITRASSPVCSGGQFRVNLKNTRLQCSDVSPVPAVQCLQVGDASRVLQADARSKSKALGCFQSYTRQTAHGFCCVAVLKLSLFLTVQSDLDKRITAWVLELLFEALGWLSSC